MHRGYYIAVDHPCSGWRVYMKPIFPWLPILGKPDFTWRGSEQEALLEAIRRIDELLATN